MSKTCSFIKAGAILGGTVIVTAAVAPLFLPNQNVKPLDVRPGRRKLPHRP